MPGNVVCLFCNAATMASVAMSRPATEASPCSAGALLAQKGLTCQKPLSVTFNRSIEHSVMRVSRCNITKLPQSAPKSG